MLASELVAELQRLGVTLWEEGGKLRYRAPRGVLTEDRLVALRERKQDVLELLRAAAGMPVAVTAHPDQRYEPFPLTDVQAAYLLGRRSSFAYGGVGCHGYGELEYAELDPDRLQVAFRGLVRRHDMLRAVVAPDGSQRIQPEVPDYRIAVTDVRGRSAQEVAAAVEAARAELGTRQYQPGDWPLFDLRVTLRDERPLLHFSIDFLIADFVSLQVLLDDLHRLYAEPQRPLPELSITFRDYRLAERALRSGPGHERDRAYWLERVDDLPPAPELPARDAAAVRDEPVRFTRHEVRLEPEVWEGLRRNAGRHDVSPSTAVLAAYAEVLAAWSRRPRFTLDVTLLNRAPLHPDVDRLVGDFTGIELLAVDAGAPGGFAGRARAAQRQLWADLDHRLFSGVELIREVSRRRGADAALFPVVFTSAIGLGDSDAEVPGAGRFVHGISQTPQVWIDCQNIERAGGLDTNWDVRDGVLPADLVADAFAAYAELLRQLAATSDEAWTAEHPVPLPRAQARRREQVNDTARPLPDGLLHERFFAAAARRPERPAVLASGGTVSYGELAGRAAAVAGALEAAGVRPGQLVGVVMDKGVEQVTAVLAILLAGAAYVPVDAGQPPARREVMLTAAGISVVATQSWLAGQEWPAGITAVVVDGVDGPPPDRPPRRRADPGDLAYVIHTSGSTGQPKGVMISHRGALNTCVDISGRFGVGPDDRVLGLAALGFDLSVYDIVGPLSVGGALVLPDARRRGDPSHWAELIARHGVTVWNSVPVQLQMLDDYLRAAGPAAGGLPTLRLALLSGDWIPLPLPDRVRATIPGLRLVSLGGATEASIWSICHEIVEAPLPAEWRSVPYGRPLANQTFAVLDERMHPCPDWVTGELYIGGAGLALGYLGDEARTAERFVVSPVTGERLYRTGDLGRYLPSGEIEFLGREDFQVKIRGHRIELAEVESALLSFPAVSNAAVLAHGEQPLERRLAAFVTPAPAAVPPGERRRADERLAAAADEAGERARAGVAADDVVAFAEQLDRAALLAMVGTLVDAGLFAGGAAHDLAGILDRARVPAAHHRLVRRWLRALTGRGLLDRDESGHYRLGAAAGDPAGVSAELAAAWRRLDELQARLGAGAGLLAYFRAAADRLPELLSGALDPLRLLFPDGRLDVHDAAYRENVASRYLNHLALGAVRQLAEDSPRPLRVLDAGAGVGGTSVDLVEALAEHDVDYRVGHASPFFLNQAAERFRDLPWVSYGALDLDADLRVQGYAPNSVDVVVSTNAMHYARDAGRTVERLRELLRPGGHLVFVDATRDSYPLLVSTEFLLDGTAGDYADARRDRDETFLSADQWRQLLTNAGAEMVLSRPAPDDPYAAVGMSLFVVRMKGDRVPVDLDELGDHLAGRLPDYMVPATLEVVDALPVNANGKLDRAALHAWLGAADAPVGTTAGGEPADDLERRLAALWAGTMRLDRVGRDADFFTLGGDSLLAAQLAGRIRDELPEAAGHHFDDLLRELLEGATVSGQAARLRVAAPAETAEAAVAAVAGAGSADAPAASVVDLGAGADGVPWLLVPDGSGTLAAWDPLIGGLAGRVGLAGLVLDDPAAFLAAEPAEALGVLADAYAAAVRAAGYDRVRLLGRDLGGPVTAALAGRLAEAGTDVHQLVVVTAGAGQPGAPGTNGSAGADAAADAADRAAFARSLGVRPGDLDAIAAATAAAGIEIDVRSAYPVFRQARRAAATVGVGGGGAAGAAAVDLYLGDVVLVRAAGEPGTDDEIAWWREVCLGDVQVVDLPPGAGGPAAVVAAVLGSPAPAGPLS
jgi:pyochelin synthetase